MFTRQEVPNLSRPVFYSAVAHVLLVVVLSVLPSLQLSFGSKPIQMVWVELPRGISEDIGTGLKEAENLPKSTIQEQKELLKQKETQEDPEQMKEPVKQTKKQPPVEKKLPKEQQKIKDALAKIDKQLKKRVIQPEASQIGGSGEGYKYGTSDQPLRVSIDDPEYVKYQAMIRAKVMEEWLWIVKQDEPSIPQVPKIVVMMNEDGEVISTQWEQRSSNSSLDASCVRAIQRASPFDPPPEKLKWEAYNEGFLVECNPRMKQ